MLWHLVVLGGITSKYCEFGIGKLIHDLYSWLSTIFQDRNRIWICFGCIPSSIVDPRLQHAAYTPVFLSDWVSVWWRVLQNKSDSNFKVLPLSCPICRKSILNHHPCHKQWDASTSFLLNIVEAKLNTKYFDKLQVESSVWGVLILGLLFQEDLVLPGSNHCVSLRRHHPRSGWWDGWIQEWLGFRAG